MKKFFAMSLCLLVLSFVAPSCKDDEEDCAQTAANLQDELTAMQNAAIAYGLNPSTDNCNAYRAAAQAYIDEAEDLVNCPGLSASQRAQYEASLQDAEDELNALSC